MFLSYTAFYEPQHVNMLCCIESFTSLTALHCYIEYGVGFVLFVPVGISQYWGGGLSTRWWCMHRAHLGVGETATFIFHVALFPLVYIACCTSFSAL